MQIKRLAALSLAAIFTAAMLTGCDLLAWLAWLEENSDSSSVTSSPGLTSIRVGTGIISDSATIGNLAFEGVPDDVIIYYPSELETNLEALKEKLKNAGLDTENYEPETEMPQTAPAAPAGVKELLDTARLFGL